MSEGGRMMQTDRFYYNIYIILSCAYFFSLNSYHIIGSNIEQEENDKLPNVTIGFRFIGLDEAETQIRDIQPSTFQKAKKIIIKDIEDFSGKIEHDGEIVGDCKILVGKPSSAVLGIYVDFSSFALFKAMLQAREHETLAYRPFLIWI